MGIPRRGRGGREGKLTSVLAWTLRHGEHERFLERLAQQPHLHGAAKAAETIASKPKLHEDLQDVWHAFWQLRSTVTVGFAASNPIAARDVMAWCEIHGVPAHQRAWWWRMLSVLDAEWMRHQRRKKEPANGDPGDGAGRERDPAGSA